MSKRKIRVGFDFDGVLFYNPFRILRPLIYVFKRYVLGMKVTKFYIPKRSWTQSIAGLLHRSSFKPNRGFDEFLRLLKDPNYEVYIITARMKFLKDDLGKLLKKFDVSNVKQIIQNHSDEQPHLYKERLIKQLGLDYYVEDNWDIVKHLRDNTQTKIVWIHNLLDRIFIRHPHHSDDLRGAVKIIRGK